MRRLLFVGLALFVAAAVGTIISTDAATAQDLFDEPGSAVAVYPTDQAKPRKVDGKVKLQAEFLELSKARAEMMTEQELTQAIAKAKKVNNRIAARRDLERAMAILGEIVDKHPDTPEGRAALRGKQVLRVTEMDSRFAGFPKDDPFGDLRAPVKAEARPEYERPGKRTVTEPSDVFEKPSNPFREPSDVFRKPSDVFGQGPFDVDDSVID